MADVPLKEVVRNRIRSLRSARRLTQEELCERAEISVDAVNRIENGSRVPTIDTLEKIATAFGMSAADLLAKPAPKASRLPATVRRLVTMVEHQPAEVQESIEEIVRITLKLAKQKRAKRR